MVALADLAILKGVGECRVKRGGEGEGEGGGWGERGEGREGGERRDVQNLELCLKKIKTSCSKVKILMIEDHHQTSEIERN